MATTSNPLTLRARKRLSRTERSAGRCCHRVGAGGLPTLHPNLGPGAGRRGGRVHTSPQAVAALHGTRLCTGGCDSQAVLIHSLDELSHQNHACVSSDSDDDPRTKSLPGRRWPHAPLFYAASQSTYRISSSCPPQSDGWAGRAKSSLKSSLHNINSWYCLRLCLLFVSLCLPQRPVRDLWGTNNKE